MTHGYAFLHFPLHAFYQLFQDHLAVEFRIFLHNLKIMQIIFLQLASKPCEFIRNLYALLFQFPLTSFQIIFRHFFSKMSAPTVNRNIHRSIVIPI